MIRYPMFLVNSSVPIILQMFPNPASISIQESKIYSKNFTLSGSQVTEHWGSDFSVMSVKGKTQGIVGDFDNEAAVEATLFALRQIYRLDKVETLSLLPAFSPSNIQSFAQQGAAPVVKQLINGTIDPALLRQLSSTYIYYRYDVYTGFFSKFAMEQSAETSARFYEYSWEFVITQTAQNLLADMMFLPTTVRQAELTTAIGLAASSAAIPNLIRSFTALGQDITNGFTNNPALGAGVATAVAASAAGKAFF